LAVKIIRSGEDFDYRLVSYECADLDTCFMVSFLIGENIDPKIKTFCEKNKKKKIEKK